MSENAEYPISGSCQCGNITYQLTAPPLVIAACHCRECQKLSTSAFSITAMVKADTLKIDGNLKHWERSSDSGAINAAEFCPDCGNRIYHFNPEKPDVLKLKPSTLSDTSIIKPTMHIWVEMKQGWYDIPEGVEQYDRSPW